MRLSVISWSNTELTCCTQRCCIDKTSSAELSEAINSMFRWYRNSAICYAYLDDVSFDGQGPVDLESCGFGASRWFSRGWTLQELIAPSHVVFKSAKWHQLGTKDELQVVLSRITGIEMHYLSAADLDTASTAKKMSWAAHRQTSRVEDRAYSLFGIFNVNLPLIYGEGEKAFSRLQAEILRVKPEDHSIFAWGKLVNASSLVRPGDDNLTPKPSAREAEPLSGLLAKSPNDFAESGEIMPYPWADRFYTPFYTGWTGASLPSVVGSAVKIEFPEIKDIWNFFPYTYLDPEVTQERPGKCAWLLCMAAKHPYARIYIPLLLWGPGYTGRRREIVIDTSIKIMDHHASSVFQRKTHFHITPEPRVARLSPGDILIRRSRDTRGNLGPSMSHMTFGRSTYDFNRIIQCSGCLPGNLYGFYKSLHVPNHPDANFLIVFSRYPRPAPGRDLTLEFHAGVSVSLDQAPIYGEDFGAVPVPAYEHSFRTPVDQWTVSWDPLPIIQISVERIAMSSNPYAYIDAVDLLVYNPTLPNSSPPTPHHLTATRPVRKRKWNA